MLIDPDTTPPEQLFSLAESAARIGAAAILVGGSLVCNDDFDKAIRNIKSAVEIPVVIFPGNGRQISVHADGILFMSLLSGRNPQYLIGEQVHAAPIIRKLGLESISTGYLLIESGCMTSVEFMSNTRPIPRNKPAIAVAHAQAAELMGMACIYLEAGSGAQLPVPPEMIKAISNTVSIPVIVGGGIRSTDEAVKAASSGVRAIVVGTAVEENGCDLIGEMVSVLRKLKP